LYVLPSLFGLTLVLSVGCGKSGPAMAPVKGRVTLDGQPIENAAVVFYPERGRAAMATTDQVGAFELTTFTQKDGALVGRHTISIKATEVMLPDQPKTFEEEAARGKNGGAKPLRRGIVKWKVPQGYSDPATSGLTADVRPGRNSIDLRLTSSASAKKDR
jgi:hypothetical protein